MESWQLPGPQKIVCRLGYRSILAIGLALTTLALLSRGRIEPPAERFSTEVKPNQRGGRFRIAGQRITLAPLYIADEMLS
jgi:hypothetical protein